METLGFIVKASERSLHYESRTKSPRLLIFPGNYFLPQRHEAYHGLQIHHTSGRNRGKKAAERWKTDPDGKYAQEQGEALSNANKRRSASGRSQSYKIAAYFDDTFSQTGHYPIVSDAAAEFAVSVRTVQRALSRTGIVLPTGRKKGDRP